MAKNTKRVILVTGATGKQGGSSLRRLHEKGYPVRALTRDPNSEKARALMGQGAEVRRGDLNEPASLTQALDGVYGVHSVQASGPDEVRQGTGLADAAKRSGVSHFVYSSVGSADQKTGIPHFETKFQVEEHLRSSGLRYTVFRPVFFMENWLGMKEQIEQGVLAMPMSPDTRLQMIATDDIGTFVTMAFEKPGHWSGRALDIAGDELSMTDLAQAFGRMTGHEVRYEQVPWDQFESQAGHEMTLMYRWFQDVGYHVDISSVRQELPNLMGFERWLQSKWTKRFAA